MLGSVMMISNQAGLMTDRYHYDVFGNNYTGSLAGSNALGYGGKRYDPATSLYDYGFRDYDTSSGRFTTVDPIRDGVNWYVYCNNDPVNFFDLWGLKPAQDKNQTKIVEYLIPESSRNRPGTKITEVKAVVIHWTEVPNQNPKDTIDYWSSDTRIGSAHFVIGTDGTTYQAIPIDERARHAGNADGEYKDKATQLFGDGINPNAYSIGIEIEPINAKGEFTKQSIDSAIELTSKLCDKFDLDPENVVIRHYDVTGKDCPKYFVDNEDEWKKFVDAVNEKIGD